jgi:Protein of unknown function (DUF3631)
MSGIQHVLDAIEDGPIDEKLSTSSSGEQGQEMSESEQDILDAIENGSIAKRLSAPLSAEEIDALVGKAKTDPGAPFENDVIARIAATKRADLAKFIRLQARLKEANIKVGELDKALTGLRGTGAVESDGRQGRVMTFPEIEPWPEPVEGSILLDEIVDQIRRYVMLPPEAANAVALWIMHAYCFDAFTTSPRLAVTAPEKRCGKTTLLDVIEALVPRARFAANITAAAMFRTIEKYRPTLLIDEAETFLPDNEALRGVINSGHRRNGSVTRLVGDDFEPRDFSTFCPTAIAAVGSLPGTIEDRAIEITMRRRLKSEPVDRFRSDRAGHLHKLARKAARWAADHRQVLCDADPDMPEALHDRACDNWRPLLAIADLARWQWPSVARIAAKALSSQVNEQDDQSRGVMLLADIKRVFDDRQKMARKDSHCISSSELSAALHALTDRPWATWSRGKPITPAAVARRLKDFNVVPNTIKLSDGRQPNGYKRSQFDDAFARYLPQAPSSPAGSSPSSPTPANSEVSTQPQGSPEGPAGEGSESAQSLEEQGRGEDGEDSNPQIEGLDESDDVDDDQLAQITREARRARLELTVDEEVEA